MQHIKAKHRKRLLAVLLSAVCLVGALGGTALTGAADTDPFADDIADYPPAAADFIPNASGWIVNGTSNPGEPTLGDGLLATDTDGHVHLYNKGAGSACLGFDYRREPVTIDGLHMVIDPIRWLGDAVDDNWFGLYLGNALSYEGGVIWNDGQENLMFRIDTNTGNVTAYAKDGSTTLFSDEAAVRELCTYRSRIGFAVDDTGAVTMTINNVSGRSAASAPIARYPANWADRRHGYLAVVGSNTCRPFTVDVLAIHDGDALCAASITAEDRAAADAVAQAIDGFGTVGGDEETLRRLEELEASYAALGKLKALVKNGDRIAVLRSLYLAAKAAAEPVQFDAEHRVLALGGITDTHNSTNVPAAYRTLTAAAGGRLDGLLCAGDITDGVVYGGTASWEIAAVRDAFTKLLPDDLPFVFCLGNHDSAGGSNAALFYDTLGERFYRTDLDKDSARTAANRHVKIGGYHFLAVECTYQGTGYTEETVGWLKNTLEAIESDPDYHGEYIFLMTHAAVTGTVTAQGDGAYTGLKDLLSAYPQAIVLSGHSHDPIHVENAIMQTAFTAVHMGAVQYLGMPNKYVESVPPWLLADSYELPTCLLIEVDAAGAVRFTRYDARTGDPIKQPWVIPAPRTDRSHLYYYTNARAEKAGPQFADGATVSPSSTEDSLSLSFSAAKDTDMVFSYQIDLIRDGTTQQTFTSLSGFYRYDDPAQMPDTHRVELTGITVTRPYTVKITAADCWGNTGNSLTAQITAVSAADRAAAENADALIDAIGQVDRSSGDLIRAARAAYDALTPAQKALVTKLSVLEESEAAFARLAEEDRAAAENADALIGAIGQVDRSSGDLIRAARAAYDALTPAQKALVTKLSVLEESEAAFARLAQEQPPKPNDPDEPPHGEPEKPNDHAPTTGVATGTGAAAAALLVSTAGAALCRRRRRR